MNSRKAIFSIVAMLVIAAGIIFALSRIGSTPGPVSTTFPNVASVETGHADEHGEKGGDAHEGEHAEGEGAHDDHPNTVTLSKEQMESAGIRIETVSARGIRESIKVSGVIRPDPDRTGNVVARLEGRVVQLVAREGDNVSEGALLAVIDSPQVADRRAAVRAAALHVDVASRRLERLRRLAHENIESSGPTLEAKLRRDRARTEAERARRVWERARRLYPDVVSQRDYEAARAEYDNARAELSTSEQLYARERQMAARGTRQRVDTATAEGELDEAQADLAAARESLAALGVGDGTAGEITISAPLNGVVTTRPVSRGQWVDAGEALFTIVDVTAVWAMLDVYEKDLPRVVVGQEVEVRSPAVPGHVFTGRISHISPVLEEQARTAHARVSLLNPGRRLRSDMFVNAQIMIAGRGRGIVVPSEAVMTDENITHVYVEQEPGHFVLRRVEVGPPEDGMRIVRSGLKPGERIVMDGTFVLKSEQRKGEMGDDDHH